MNYGPNIMDIYPPKKVDIFPKELFPPQAFFYDKYDPNRNALVFSGTNSGKTFYARHAINGGLLEGKTCVMLAPSKQLVWQKYQEFINMSGYGAGIVGMATGDRKIKEEKPLMITSPERFISALRNKERWAMDVKLIVVDEIHNIIRPGSRGEMVDVAVTLGVRNGVRILGLSGSIPGHHKDKLARWLDADLYESNFSPSVIERQDIPTSDKPSELKKIVGKHKGEFIMIFTPTKEESENVAKLIGCQYFHSELTPATKKKVLKKFEEGVDKILATTSGLSEGINSPTDVVVVYGLRRTPSSLIDSLETQQMVARAARFPKVKGTAYVLGDINEIFWATKGINERCRSIATGNIALTMLSMKGEIGSSDVKSITGLSYGASFFNDTEKVVEINDAIDDMSESGIVCKSGDKILLTTEGAVLSHYFLSPLQYIEYLNFASIFTGKISETKETTGEDDGYEVVSDDKGGIKEIELFSILIAILLETYSKPQKSFLNRLQFKLIQNGIVSPPSSIPTAASILEAFVNGKGVGMKSVSYALYNNMSRWLSALDEIERAGKKVPFLSSVKIWVKRLRAVLYKKKVKKGTGEHVVLDDDKGKGVTADEFVSKIVSSPPKLLTAIKTSFETFTFSDEDKKRIKEAIDTREKELKVVSIAA